MIGIYKITSPSNKVYIGQSVNINVRFKTYRFNKLNAVKEQIRLYRSLLKYGVDNHKFEVIEECDINDLNNRERYWQDFYNVLSNTGLNCKLQSTNELKSVHSTETKKKISLGNKGKIITDERKEQNRIAQIPYSKPVYKINAKTNEILGEYPSIKEAARQNNINPVTIRGSTKRINKKSRTLHRWILVDDYKLINNY